MRSARLTVLGIAAAAVAATAGVSAFAGPGPDVSQCGGGVAPAGSPIGAAGAVLVLASNQGAETSDTVSCSYVFNGTTAPQYSAATPNTWTITATHSYPATAGNCAAGAPPHRHTRTATQYSAATPNTWTITATHSYPATAGTCAAGDTLSGTTCTHTDATASGG